MAAARRNTVVIAALLVALLLLILYATGIPAAAFEPVGYPTIEPFASAPMKASECNCLAGYVPSNTPPKLGDIIRYGTAVAFVPFNTKDRYWISSCSLCGVNWCDSSKWRQIEKAEWESYRAAGNFTCSMYSSLQKAAQDPGRPYFCQSITDPAKTRQCY